MRNPDNRSIRISPAGFTLPAVLVVCAALLILAVGIVSLVGIERRTARSYVDLQRAELAARAGLEDVLGVLKKEGDNDDFLVIADRKELPVDPQREPIPNLYVARATGGGQKVNYRFVPLFSSELTPPDAAVLKAPDAANLVGGDAFEFETLPWQDKSNVSWIPIEDVTGKVVSRYAFWVEDLQGKLDGKVSGNKLGTNDQHARTKFPDPTWKPLDIDEPPMSAIAIQALDPEYKEIGAASGPAAEFQERIFKGRPFMLSPDSILGAAGFSAPLERLDTGKLSDLRADGLERNVSPLIQPYKELPLIPRALGIEESMSGKPKLNLNALLAKEREAAVAEFATQIRSALPEFDTRKGLFPEGEDYLKTLAANALDYADADNDPTVGDGYRGLDTYPMLSEICLKIAYLGNEVRDGRRILKFQFRLFGEFWNMTNLPVSGGVRLSYEAKLNHSPIGSGVAGKAFDDPAILDNPQRSTHDLVSEGGRYWTTERQLDLRADEYKFLDFANVLYFMDAGPENMNLNSPFTLTEKETSASGVSVKWNGYITERVERIVRDSFETDFIVRSAKTISKNAIPGHSYGPYGTFVNNMGDPRISHYLRETALGENSGRNVSPNRRNVRRATIYDSDSGDKRKHYGRVLPSEWPDGGHDSSVGTFAVYSDITLTPDPTSTSFNTKPTPDAGNAPQRISNVGRFYSVTELGNTYDPILWSPSYPDIPKQGGSGIRDTQYLNAATATMPAARNMWPEVSNASAPSADYGGGNTLRIGRPEHQRFDDAAKPGKRAAKLLDLFHTGIASSEDAEKREGKYINVEGQVNVNTATPDSLRAVIAGKLEQDPQLRAVTNWNHQTTNGRYAATSSLLDLGTASSGTANTKVADKIVDAIVKARPFATVSDVAAVRNSDDRPVFGNRELYPEASRSPNKDIQWSDAAAEEVFARFFESSTVRSRNFRVWVVGQSLAGSSANPEILAETRKVFTVFADPGDRNPDGTINTTSYRPRVMYENDF